MKQRWEDWTNLALGAWLFFSPFIMGYTQNQGAAWNAYTLGIMLGVFTIWALASPEAWEEWIDSALGLWLVVSPWILGFSSQTGATWNAVIVGLVVLGISLEATRAGRQAPTS